MNKLLIAAGICVMGAAAFCGESEEEETMVGAAAVNRGFFAVPAKGEVKIDGSLDEWDMSGEIQSFNDYDAREQFSVRTAAMWDDKNLYLSFLWKDPLPLNSTVDPDLEPEIGWLADALQLRVVAGEQVSWVTSWSFKGNSALHTVFWEDMSKVGKSKTFLFKGANGSGVLKDGVESVYKMLPAKDGFIHELKLPWDFLHQKKAVVKAGYKIKLQLEFMWGDETGHLWPLLRLADNCGGAMNWGDHRGWKHLTLLDKSVAKKRKYAYLPWKSEGTIPVRVTIPAEAKSVTIVIEDKDGRRVRNLVGGINPEDFRVGEIENGRQTVEVMWDGLDDAKKLVAPGSYNVRGLTHGGLTSKYVMSFYNPGTPPWETPDGLGAWGADHSRVKIASRSGENMILSTGFSEGGYGIFALGPDGKKLWSEKRGVILMAATEKYVFAVPTHWHTTHEVISRYDAKKGGFVPFKTDDGKTTPELSLEKIVGRELKQIFPETVKDLRVYDAVVSNPRVAALATGPKTLLIGIADGIVVEIDQETAQKVAEHNLGYDTTRMVAAEHSFTGEPVDRFAAPMAFDGKQIYFYRKGELTTFNVATKKFAVVETETAVESPIAIALGDDGSIYVSDRGSDNQVKRFTREGKLVATYGKKGGRARKGKFDPEGMREMSSVAVDSKGVVWSVEFTDFPRRVSLWGANGKLLRDYIGNTGYSGVGAVLHDSEPGRAFIGANEFSIDEKNYSYKVEGVMSNPEPGEPTFGLGTGSNEAGHAFSSNASGKKRDYYYREATLFMFAEEKNEWRPVSAVRNVGQLQGLFSNRRMVVVNREPFGGFAGRNAYDIMIWNDKNGDGKYDESECELVKEANVKYKVGETVPWFIFPRWTTGWGSRMDANDLSFYMLDRNGKGDRMRFAPASFGADGAPIYTATTTKKLGEYVGIESYDMHPVLGEDTVIMFSRKGKQNFVMGFDKMLKIEKWAYPDPFDNVHGSHGATMPQPGLLIGPLKVTGVVNDCGEAKGVFMMRGNLGSDFYITTDGLFVGSMFKDCRLPRNTFPRTEEALRRMPFHTFTMGGEPFNGWIGRQKDGVVRMLCGYAETAMLCTIGGLDGIKRFTSEPVGVTSEMLVKADAANIARATAVATGAPYKIASVGEAPTNWNKIPAMAIDLQGLETKAKCRLAYSAENLFVHFEIANDETPWLNKGKDKTRMFKTGDCVDLCLSATANKGGAAKEGDMRVVMSPDGDKSIAMLMRKVWSKAGADEKVRYQSPVRAFEMAQVKEIGAPVVKVNGKSVTVDAVFSWKELGIEAKSGLALRGDAGVILSDPAGTANSARIYYSNKQTHLVNDLPSEADLYPNMWTDFVLE